MVIDELIDGLRLDGTPERLAAAAIIASLPDHVRGFEDLELERTATYRADLARHMAQFRT